MSLARLLFSVIFLKSTPQDIEYNQRSLGFVVLFYLLSGVFVLSYSIAIEPAIYNLLLDIVVLIVFSVACLTLLQLKARAVQTLIALFGTGVIYHFLAWPIIEQLSLPNITDSAKGTLSLFFLMLLSWQILVNAHIYRNALSIDTAKAVVLSIAYWLMSVTLSQIIFPAV